MEAKTILLLVVTGALALSAPASALLPTGAADAAPPVTAPAALAATDVVLPAEGIDIQETMDALPDACTPAVRITIPWWGGTVTDARHDDASWVQTEALVQEVTKTVPIVETVTKTLWEPNGALDFLGPVTHEVQEVTGYQTVVEEVERELDVGVHVKWYEEYVVWTPEELVATVTLPVGLPFVAEGEGVLTEVCPGDPPALGNVPLVDHTGYDYYGVGEEFVDGWIVDLLDVQVWLATAQDMAVLPWGDGSGYCLCPDALEQAFDKAFQDGLGSIDPDTVSGDDQDETAEADGDEVAGLGPASAAAAVVGKAPLAGALAAVAAGLATAGTLAWRRRRD